jgi:16S rRNA (uracil1498-N3)-methyltransferase
MSAPVFLLDGHRLRSGERLELDGDEGRHAATVRRMRPGEAVWLTDGAGHVAECAVESVSRDRLVCAVRARRDVPMPSPRLTVVQALPKGDRGELAVELMTEVGVDAIVPWSASHCVTRWKGERGDKSLRRWRSAAREAAKQARRAWLPAVEPCASTAHVVRILAGAQLAVSLHESADVPLGALELPGDGDVVLVVGPEGGLADSELDAFAAAGARPARLGPTVMRTSTAGAVAAGAMLSRTARWA